MHQRSGKYTSLEKNDMIALGDLIKFIRKAQDDLENALDHDAALRFEILGDFLELDVAVERKPFEYSTKAIGL